MYKFPSFCPPSRTKGGHFDVFILSSAQLFDGFHLGISCLSAVLDGGADAGAPFGCPVNVQPSADSQDSFYLPGESDCMTLLLCEQRQDPQLFLLMRFQPVRGSIFLFAFPRQMLLQLDGVREPVGNIFASHGIQGCAPPSNRASPSPATAT